MRKCKITVCFCGRSPAAVRGLLSCQPQFLQRGSETALHAPLCHFECVSLAPALCLPVSPRLPAQRPSAMMGFSDGIKMSSPTAVTHANCIVYKVYHWEQPAICFAWRPFPFSFFYHSVIICSPAASLVNVSDMSSFNLPLLSFAPGCRFTDTPTWPPTASTIFTHGKCCSFCFETTCQVENICILHWALSLYSTDSWLYCCHLSGFILEDA